MYPSAVGPFIVGRKIGEGGMGAVFEGAHESLNRRVAIKFLLPQCAANQELVRRFFNEAHAANAVEHPGLIQIYDCGQLADGTAYLVMEFLRGETLHARLANVGAPLPIEQTIRLAEQLSDALAEVHARGIVHRDLKPENIMLVPDAVAPGRERSKILDFGIAKLAQGIVPAKDKTRTGMLMGTPLCMSPEQCKGVSDVDDKSDVYSLGVVLFRCLAGRYPFDAEGVGELLGQHLFVESPALRSLRTDVPPRIDALVRRMLTKEKTGRPTMREVHAACQSFLIDEEHRAAPVRVTPRRVMVSILALGCLGLAGGSWILFQKREPIPKRERLVVDEPAPVKAAPIPVKKVRWSVDSIPSGATVLRQASREVLGRTPFLHEQPAQPGVATLILQLDGHKEQTLELPNGADAMLTKRMETAPPPPSQNSSARPAPSRTPSVQPYRPKSSGAAFDGIP